MTGEPHLLNPEPDEPSSERVPGGRPRRAPSATRRKPRVLLVEDCEDVREIYAMCMRAAGWTVDAVSNAFDALDRAMQTPPDVIVMDLHMPGLDGVETTRLLKTDPRTAHVSVIACTAFWSDHADGVHAFDGVVRKPCEPDDLLAYVERFLAERERA